MSTAPGRTQTLPSKTGKELLLRGCLACGHLVDHLAHDRTDTFTGLFARNPRRNQEITSGVSRKTDRFTPNDILGKLDGNLTQCFFTDGSLDRDIDPLAQKRSVHDLFEELCHEGKELIMSDIDLVDAFGQPSHILVILPLLEDKLAQKKKGDTTHFLTVHGTSGLESRTETIRVAFVCDAQE